MLTPSEIAANFVNIGVQKTTLNKIKVLCLGVFAGVFVALAGAGSAIAACTVANASVARFLNALIFPAGLVMVILAGSELFTGNSLIVISVLEKKVSIRNMFINWLIVYLGNFLGSLLVVFIFVYGHIPDMFQNGLASAMVANAATKTSLSFGDAFLRGILCNIVVCIAVWVAAASKNVQGKILALYLPIVVFVLCGFEHCVANMFCIPAGIFVSYEYELTVAGLNWMGFLHNMVSVTLGNIVGGCMVGIGYWFIYLHRVPTACGKE